LGARLLPQVSKSPPGIHRSLVERSELGSDRGELCGRQKVSRKVFRQCRKTKTPRTISGAFFCICSAGVSPALTSANVGEGSNHRRCANVRGGHYCRRGASSKDGLVVVCRPSVIAALSEFCGRQSRRDASATGSCRPQRN